MERQLVPPTGIRSIFLAISPPRSLLGILQLIGATVRLVSMIKRLGRRATLATGGYVCVPGSIASWLLRVPVILFLPDTVPGRAVSWLVPIARKVAVTTDEALDRVPRGKGILTGYPVRAAFFEIAKSQARLRLGLPDDAVVLCVMGGSQGARSINEAIAPCLANLLSTTYVLHISGEKRFKEAEEAAAGLTPEQRSRYQLFPYLDEAQVADVLAAANFVLSRSGASVLGELAAVGVGAVLVPFPDPGVHQQQNAEYLERKGAAVVVNDAELKDRLPDVLTQLLNDRARLSQMAQAASALARPEAAAHIAALLETAA